MTVFEPARIGSVELPNRILRSATFEGLCGANGTPGDAYVGHYGRMAAQGLGGLITGFTFVSQDGRAMQPGQAGIESDAKVGAFRRVTRAVHDQGGRVFLQLAHAGRQTSPTATGGRVFGPSDRKSPYFRHRPRRLTAAQIERIINAFAQAARRAREAGFDGVQLHAAHGYLIHQFLHPAINDRTDVFGLAAGSGIGTTFLAAIIDRVRFSCGADFPLLIKISAGDYAWGGMGEPEFIALIRFLDARRLDAIEISFGTMDEAFNIFRCESLPLRTILDFNPRFRARSRLKRFVFRAVAVPILKRQLAPFTPAYNLAGACLARTQTRIPIISVGGFRNGDQIRNAIEEDGIAFVSLCRPLICEPDFVLRLRENPHYESRCRNCNRCAVMCDSGRPTRCYRQVEPSAARAAADLPQSEGATDCIRISA